MDIKIRSRDRFAPPSGSSMDEMDDDGDEDRATSPLVPSMQSISDSQFDVIVDEVSTKMRRTRPSRHGKDEASNDDEKDPDLSSNPRAPKPERTVSDVLGSKPSMES